MQIFLLHFAGGNVYSYNFLKKENIRYIDLIPLELPGRGKRIGENLIRNRKDAVKDYFSQIKELRNGEPYIIFGHSMGAILGFYTTIELEASNDLPEALIVSGSAEPRKDEGEEFYLLNQNQFKAKLKELGGTPDEVIDNKELFSFFEPILRSDFECIEKDIFEEETTIIKTPIYAIMGTEEKAKNKIENWKKFTRGKFEFKILQGNHFFIYNHSDFLITLFKQLQTLKKIPDA